MKRIQYNLTINNYNLSGFVTLQDQCNGYTVTNIGDTIAEINGIVLFPSATPATAVGDSISIGGNEDEIYKGSLKLSFRAPVGAAPLVEIIQKYYID